MRQILKHLDDICVVFGLGSVTCGVLLWSIPAGLIVFGVGLIGIGFLVGAGSLGRG